MNVVIPSYKRADKLVGKDYFYYAKYVIPKSQEKDYLKVLKAERLIVIPDSHDGNIPKKRNWILKNVARPLLMIDDDVKNLCMVEGMHDVSKKDHQKATEKVYLEPDHALKIIKNGFNLAHQWGCIFWGINLNTDGRNYQQYKPFSLNQVILGPFQGHLKHDVLFDERMGTKDDYDFSLQVLNKYRKVLRLNKYSYDCEHGFNAGGLCSMRTMEKEKEYCRRIMGKWGDKIIKYNLNAKKYTDLLNGRVNIPI